MIDPTAAQQHSPNSPRWRICNIFALVVTIVIASAICFTNLEARPFINHDESIHSQVVYEMYTNGTYLAPTLKGTPYKNKPPLKMWLSALSLKVFGVHNFSFRFVDALAGVGTVILVYLLGIMLFQSIPAAMLAALALVSSKIFLFNHLVRHATQDSMLVFLTTASLTLSYYAIERVSQHRSSTIWFAGAGSAIGLALITKSIAGLIPLTLIGLFVLTESYLLRRKIITSITTLISVALIPPLLWYLPRYYDRLVSPRSLFEVHRFSKGYHNKEQPLLYITELLNGSIISVTLLSIGTIFALIYIRERRWRFLLLWAYIPLIALTMLSSRIIHYLAPAFPAYALLCGGSIFVYTTWLKHRWISLIAAVGIIVSFYIVSTECYHRYSTVSKTPEQNTFERVIYYLRNNPELTLYIHPVKDKIRWLGKNHGLSFYLQLIKEQRRNTYDKNSSIVIAPEGTHYESAFCYVINRPPKKNKDRPQQKIAIYSPIPIDELPPCPEQTL